MNFDFSRAKACLTVFGSKTLDIDLCIFYSKSSLGNATTDKFPEQDSVKINDNDGKTKKDTHKNITKQR